MLDGIDFHQWPQLSDEGSSGCKSWACSLGVSGEKAGFRERRGQIDVGARMLSSGSTLVSALLLSWGSKSNLVNLINCELVLTMRFQSPDKRLRSHATSRVYLGKTHPRFLASPPEKTVHFSLRFHKH